MTPLEVQRFRNTDERIITLNNGMKIKGQKENEY